MDQIPTHKPKSKTVFFMLFGLSSAFLLVTPVLILGVLGYFLDMYFHSSPFLLVIFLGIGSIGGIINVLKLLKTLN